MSGERAPRWQPDASGVGTELLVVAARERTVLLSGFLAGLGVFFAPLAVLAAGLLAAYVGSVISDSGSFVLAPGRPLDRTDFQGVFAPAVNEAPLLVSAGLMGAILAQFRRWLGLRVEAGSDRAGFARRRRPYFREFAFLYVLLTGFVLGLAAVNGGWPLVERLLRAAPAFFLLMICATWLAQAVWSYCFGNLIELLASGPERDAAAALRGRRRLGPRSSHA
jgi:hypothetical protein